MDRIEAIGRARGLDPWTRRRSAQGRPLTRSGATKAVGSTSEAADTSLPTGQRDRADLSPAAWAMFVRWDSGD